jgi:TfoX/Sxy family transcriptional regulator of competence genes
MSDTTRAGEGGADAEAMYSRIVEDELKDERVTLGKMFGASGLRIDGKVYAMVVKGQLVVKLPRERVTELALAEGAEPFMQGGRVMKEWAAVEPTAAVDWRSLVGEAKRFVGKIASQ